jgi:Homing endonuclease associated repeat
MDDKQQKIIDELQRVAQLLKTHTLTRRQFSQNSKLSLSTIEGRFGTWNRAIEAAGLLPIPLGGTSNTHPKIPDDDLLQEIIRLSAELGKQPTLNDMSAFGHFSIRPYVRRWGKFSDAVKAAYAKYGVPPGISLVVTSTTKPENTQVTTPSAQPELNILPKTYPQRKKTQYGEPIDFRGLRHAPVNEQGVVYMFGMVSRELGFLIESLRTAYPDCEGKRCVDEKRQLWENVLIEFEFKSSNFREHGHHPEACDLIVCWIHDWDDCPLEVLELRSAISYLPNK